MRVDGKQEGPRQSMAWLHTWSSLILGWLLYAIFLTGTLSFFQNEISTWMKPELHQSVPQASQIEQTRVALNYLQSQHPNAGSWAIQLPNSRQNVTIINIRKQSENPRARRGGQRIVLDSATGEVLEARDTRGGSFLYRFHFELYGLPRTWARWIVGIATMFMFVGIISGIITHKKIFKDFFTFRPAKGQRSWLDAHNATAVFALPFHIMITLSGLLLLLFTIFPWGVERIYDNRGQFLQDQRQSVIQQNPSAEKPEPKRRPQQESSPANMTDIAPLFAVVQQHWQDNPVAQITILKPNTSAAQIEFRALHSESVAHRNVYSSLQFDGISGKNTTDESAQLVNPSFANGVYNIVTTLHEARGVDLALRWLLFMSGVVGTLMIATGLILWCVKRAPQQQKQGYKSFGYRLVEVTNIAAIIGLPIACAAYFYANRFIPADLDMRLNWEIRSFFMVWLLTLAYALFRSHRQAWLELLAFATAAFALLPLVNVLTGGQALWNSMAHGQWVIASFDLAMWVLALIFWFSFKKVKQHQGLPARKNKTTTETES